MNKVVGALKRVVREGPRRSVRLSTRIQVLNNPSSWSSGYKVDEMPQKLNSCLRRLAYSDTSFLIRSFALSRKTYGGC